jgi:hypothetical protein
MYAKNRTQCAAVKAIGPNVCEKPNTMCCCEGHRAKCMRKTEHNRKESIHTSHNSREAVRKQTGEEK